MNPKALTTLEFDKIRTMCASFAASDLGKEEAEALLPVSDLAAARMLLRQTWEADAIYRRSGRTPVESFPDLRNTLRRAPAAYSLSMGELLGIARCLFVSRKTREVLTGDETDRSSQTADQPQEANELHRLGALLSSHRTIEEEITRCILSEEEIADNASPALARIRRQMRITNERVRDKLNSIIKSTTYQKYLQEPIITMRNGRYAVPVKAEYRAQIAGLVHDQSSSGQTLFIEPTAVVELGNEYKRLLAEEKAEIERILAGLTALVAPIADELYRSLRLYLCQSRAGAGNARLLSAPQRCGLYPDSEWPSPADRFQGRRADLRLDRRRLSHANHYRSEHRRQNRYAENGRIIHIDGVCRSVCSGG